MKKIVSLASQFDSSFLAPFSPFQWSLSDIYSPAWIPPENGIALESIGSRIFWKSMKTSSKMSVSLEINLFNRSKPFENQP